MFGRGGLRKGRGGISKRTEGASLSGHVGELDGELDTLALGAGGGDDGSLDVSTTLDGGEGLLGQLGDVGHAGGVVIDGNGIAQILEGATNG